MSEVIEALRNAYAANKFVFVYIDGPRGNGKTTLAMQLLRAIHGNYKAALDHVFFGWEDLETHLLTRQFGGARCAGDLWDDAGVYASMYLPFLSRLMAAKIHGTLQLARTATAALILTSVDAEQLLRAIRLEQDSYYINLPVRGVGTVYKVTRAIVPHKARVSRYLVEIEEIKFGPLPAWVETHLTRLRNGYFLKMVRLYQKLERKRKGGGGEGDEEGEGDWITRFANAYGYSAND